MTVETQIVAVTGLGNGSATVFSFSPMVLPSSSADITVTHVDTNVTPNVETVLVEGTGASQYSVDVSLYPGTGSITYPADEVTPMPTGEEITIKRVLVLEQQTDLSNQGGYFPNTLEVALDRAIMITQQLQEIIDRAMTLPISVTDTVSAELPFPDAGNFIRWATDELSLENGDVRTLDGVVQSDAIPATLGVTAAAGTSDDISRADHTHAVDLYDNVIINGNFDFWQRGVSFTADGITADRWRLDERDGAATVSRQTFTVGQTAVPGNPTYFLRHDQTSATSSLQPVLAQHIEDVSTLSGSPITVSFWAKVSSGTLELTPAFQQNFGSGGSATSTVTETAVTVTTSWQKFTVNHTLASISGKTVGTGSYLSLVLFFPGSDTFTIDLAQIKLQKGSVATAFVPRHLAHELMLCQRYFQKSYHPLDYPGDIASIGQVVNNFTEVASTANYHHVDLSTSLRATPTVTIYNPVDGTSGDYYNVTDAAAYAAAAVNIGPTGFNVRPDVTTDVSLGDAWEFHWTADAEL